MKHFSDIQALLDRYWEGETTLEEERVLKEYFNSGNYDPRFRNEAPLFQALRAEQNVQLVQAPKVVAMRPTLYSWKNIAAAASVALLIGAGAWWWSTQPADIQQPVVDRQQTVPQDTLQTQSIPARSPELLAHAAQPSGAPKKGQAVKRRPGKPDRRPQEVDPEAEMAMEEIKAALALVSSKIRKGRQEAAKGAVHLETVDIMLKKKTEG